MAYSLNSIIKNQKFQDFVELEPEQIGLSDQPRLFKFKKSYPQTADRREWVWAPHQALAAKYPHQFMYLWNGESLLQINEWNLGGGVFLQGQISDETSDVLSNLDAAFFYMSFLYRKEGLYDGSCVWARLRKFLVELSRLQWPPQIFYFRCHPVSQNNSLKHLKLLNYLPSSIGLKTLQQKYNSHIGGRPCGIQSKEGDHYWISEFYNEKIVDIKPWPIKERHHGFYECPANVISKSHFKL